MSELSRQENAERPRLERRYGAIGISAVAAAANFRKIEKTPVAPKILARFEEEAA